VKSASTSTSSADGNPLSVASSDTGGQCSLASGPLRATRQVSDFESDT
jgi:hypothetical protein